MEINNSVLNDVAQDSTLEEAIEIIEDMKTLMFKLGGIGLAAPQVGISKRVIICVINGVPIPMINPIIVKSSADKKLAKEGCLSLPGKSTQVKRSKRITVAYMAEDGNRVAEEHSNKAARVIQHEIDHLNGITI